VSLALGAEATFVARTIDSDRKHLTSVLRAAAEHSGTALVEIYQNCNIFNDGAFEVLKDNATSGHHLIPLQHGEPIRFGVNQERGVVRGPNGTISVADITEANEAEVLIHDAHADDPGVAFALSRLPDLTLDRTPIGVFRDVSRPTYDAQMTAQLRSAAGTTGDLQRLLRGTDTWTI
jgi:2-oxoglutarate ferredoxin oxidoreductase subunit beta